MRLLIKADKRLRCYAPSPKLPSATSFIRKPLAEIPHATLRIFKNKEVITLSER